jgi:hypothetical protein
MRSSSGQQRTASSGGQQRTRTLPSMHARTRTRYAGRQAQAGWQGREAGRAQEAKEGVLHGAHAAAAARSRSMHAAARASKGSASSARTPGAAAAASSAHTRARTHTRAHAHARCSSSGQQCTHGAHSPLPCTGRCSQAPAGAGAQGRGRWRGAGAAGACCRAPAVHLLPCAAVRGRALPCVAVHLLPCAPCVAVRCRAPAAVRAFPNALSQRRRASCSTRPSSWQQTRANWRPC